MILELPYPPSNNRYYRHHHGRVLLSREGREYRATVQALLPRATTLLGRLRLTMDVYPPTRWGQDLDNIPKAVCDALQHAKVFANDQQMDELIVRRKDKDPSRPRVEVSVESIPKTLHQTALGWEPKP